MVFLRFSIFFADVSIAFANSMDPIDMFQFFKPLHPTALFDAFNQKEKTGNKPVGEVWGTFSWLKVKGCCFGDLVGRFLDWFCFQGDLEIHRLRTQAIDPKNNFNQHLKRPWNRWIGAVEAWRLVHRRLIKARLVLQLW